MPNILAIVGRPNVGKSTLYNRLIGERSAIVDDVSGVTRDRIYGMSDWNGKSFTVIDTGGFVKNSDDVFEAEIRSQVEIAIEEATVICFVTDVTTGITDLDEEVARMLRKTDKPVFVVVNKVDNRNRELSANEFWSLGFDNTFFMSALSGSGGGDMLDAITEVMEVEEEQEENKIPVFAIIGRPNVGKSTLTNALMGEKRNIVTDIAGTTRDSIFVHYNKFDKEFLLIDTAGIRKKAKVHEDLEFYSVIRAIKAIDQADVCYLMIDAQLGIESQDMQIFRLCVKRKKGIVLVVNKWDTMEKETNTARDLEYMYRQRLAPFNDIPIHFVSALEQQRIFQLVESGLNVYQRKSSRIKTSELNEFLQEVMQRTPPPSHRGKFIKIKYVTQLKAKHPAFAFFCNYPNHVKEPYKNFLENQLRKRYDFSGVPISIFFRKK